jgi:RNA polymerase sigma factor (TIGR02999 family)
LIEDASKNTERESFLADDSAPDSSTTHAEERGEVTILLDEWTSGRPEALDRLIELVYPHLRHIAGVLSAGERPGGLLQPTSVVHELFVQLVRLRSLRFEDREHFYSMSARLMRRILVDHARARNSKKRGEGAQVPFEEHLAWVNAPKAEWLDLERCLSELEQLDERKLRVLELRLFLGFTSEEAAEVLGMSKATVDRELRFTRGWLHERLQPPVP